MATTEQVLKSLKKAETKRKRIKDCSFKVYAVRSEKDLKPIGHFSIPFFARYEEDAIKAVKELCHAYDISRDNFTLVCLGDFNTFTGVISPSSITYICDIKE